MARPAIHSQQQHRPLGRMALAGLLALALMWSQSLGLWHRVAHRDLASATAAMAVQATASDAPREPGVLERLFPGHRGEADCQFFDQHSHGDALNPVASADMVLAASPGLVAVSHALAVARWHAQFQARGPPALR